MRPSFSIRRLVPGAILALSVALAGCPRKGADADGAPTREPLSSAEARAALEEASIADQAVQLTSNTIEITTDFTIGGAVEQAAEELRAFYESQLPCADVSLEGATLTVTYGARGACTHRGQTFSGTHTVSVARNDQDDVVVSHVWDRLSNGVVEVTGDAEVTWTFDDPARHVVHELTWTRLSDGRQGTGSGDRTQRPLAGGLAEGISVDGERAWRGQAGEWALDIDAVEMRWIDPIPQAGAYTLTTPAGKTLELSFDRVDGDTIRATLTSGGRSFSFGVTRGGAIEAES